LVCARLSPLDFFKIPSPPVNLKKITSTVQGPFRSRSGEAFSSNSFKLPVLLQQVGIRDSTASLHWLLSKSHKPIQHESKITFNIKVEYNWGCFNGSQQEKFNPVDCQNKADIKNPLRRWGGGRSAQIKNLYF
tara:strand:+ start:46 stop:444 length:399 start_codon:yes stop_codon:yes gene_type:complete